MKKKLVFIINPVSGVGKQKLIEKLAGEIIDKRQFEIEFQYTDAPKHAIKISEEAVKNNADIVVAVGGDGTVNEVACSLINSETRLAIIPTGSGNGVARHLKIPLDIKSALERINNLNETIIDTATLNNIPFVMIAGFGFDAFIASEFSKLKKRGFSGYLKLVLKHFAFYKPEDYTITIDGNIINKKAFLISIANCSQFGNNAYIAPLASSDDQLLNITIIRGFSIFAIGGLIYHLFNKTIHRSRFVETFTGKNIIISQSVEFSQLDGESIHTGKNIEIKVNPLSLIVIK